MKLEATVVHARGTGKVKVETVAVLKFGPLVLGSRKLAGKWSPDQVLREVQNNKAKGFTLTAQGQETLPVLLG